MFHLLLILGGAYMGVVIVSLALQSIVALFFKIIDPEKVEPWIKEAEVLERREKEVAEKISKILNIANESGIAKRSRTFWKEILTHHKELLEHKYLLSISGDINEEDVQILDVKTKWGSLSISRSIKSYCAERDQYSYDFIDNRETNNLWSKTYFRGEIEITEESFLIIEDGITKLEFVIRFEKLEYETNEIDNVTLYQTGNWENIINQITQRIKNTSEEMKFRKNKEKRETILMKGKRDFAI